MDEKILLIAGDESRISARKKSGHGKKQGLRAGLLALRSMFFAVSLFGAGLLLSGCADTADEDFQSHDPAHDAVKLQAAHENQEDDVPAEKPGDNLDQSNMN